METNAATAPAGIVAPAGLETLLRPRSVAVVGASDSVHKVGGRPLHYLRAHGFVGTVYAVNPRAERVQGFACHPTLDALPEPPDVVILSVPADAAAAQIEACGRVGARHAILFSSGFAETGDAGRRRQHALADAARRAGVRLLGPNTIGIANFACGAVLSFASIYQDYAPADGPVAVVSQSGAVGASVYALLRESGIGVRYVCASGNQADVDACELMRAIVDDADVRLLLAYLEEAADLAALDAALAHARERAVPVLLLPGARRPSGVAMAGHHTGARGLRDGALDALLSAHACRRVHSLPELAASAPLYLLRSRSAAFAPPRVGIVSNSGASCVLAADACDDAAVPLATPAAATAARLGALVPPFSRSRNPVDLTAMLLADSGLLGEAVDAMLADDGCDALALSLMAVAGPSYDVPRFAVDTARAMRAHAKPVAFSSPDGRVRQAFAAHGIAAFASERDAIEALNEHARHRRALEAVHG